MSSDEKSAISAPPSIQAVMCFAFFTRLPVHWPKGFEFKCLAGAMWAFPLVGIMVGAAGWAAGMLMFLLVGPSAWLAGTAALGTMLLMTGAMHFDGLADMADGLGGGSDRAKKLEIMKDSHIGTYGVIVLVLALLVMVSLMTSILAQLYSPWHLLGDSQFRTEHLYPALFTSAGLLLGAAAFSRAMVTCAMILLLPAKINGMAADSGPPGGAGTALAALIIASIPLMLLLPVGVLLFAMSASVIAAFTVVRIAKRHIDGYTGDVLGAVQVVSEIAYLVGGALIAKNLMLMVNMSS